MLKKLKSFLFSDSPDGAPASDAECTRFAAAVLLAEAGLMDGALDDDERASIQRLLARRFELTAAEAEALLEKGLREAHDTTQLHRHAHIVKENFSAEERTELMEMLWEVVYADGDLHDYEANLMRRLAGLLYVEDQDSGAARKRVLDRMGLS